jgi:hypothetical protein
MDDDSSWKDQGLRKSYMRGQEGTGLTYERRKEDESWQRIR